MNQVKTTLYALNKDQSFQEWKVFADGPNVVVQFGKVGGKVQTKITECEPKNIGRANETTAEEQAIAEAISKWEKQVRLGYRETTEELLTEDQFSPMLAQDAIKRSKDIIYPCFGQAKLDGLRCLVTFDEEGSPVFNSRGNKTYPIKGEIPSEIKALRKATNFDMFDGEVYLHGLSLQKIVSLAKKWRTQEEIQVEITKDFEADKKRQRKAIDEGKLVYLDFNKEEISIYTDPVRDDNRYGGHESSDLDFHIFDIPSKNKAWMIDDGISDYTDKACRYADLMNTDHWVCALRLKKIVIVHGNVFGDEDEVKESIGFYMQHGYEGSIIRNFKGVYEFGQRSTDLQKWKIFQDAEAKVVNYTLDKNNEAVLECVEQDGTKFRCKMKGTNADRNESAAKKLMNNFITFSFQARTDDGIPQFPVGLRVRAVDPITWKPLD